MTIEQINILCTKVPEKYREDVKNLLLYYYANNTDGVFDEAMNLIAYNIERYQSKGYLPLLNQYCLTLSCIYKNLLNDWKDIIPAKYLAKMLAIMEDYTERGHTIELKTMQEQIVTYHSEGRDDELECYCNHLINLWDINLEIEDIKYEIDKAKTEKETLVTEEEMRKLFWELTSVQTSVLRGGIHSYGDMVLMKENMIEFRQDLREFRDDIVSKGITPKVINTLLRIVNKGGLVESVEDGLEDSYAHLGCVRVTTNDATDKEETTTTHVKVSGLGNFSLLPNATDNIIDALNSINNSQLKAEFCTLAEYQTGQKRNDTCYFIKGATPELYKGTVKIWGSSAYEITLELNVAYKTNSTGFANDVVLVDEASTPVVKVNGSTLAEGDYTLDYYLKDNPSYAILDTTSIGTPNYRSITFTRNATGLARTAVLMAKVTYRETTLTKEVGSATQSKGSLYYKIVSDWVDTKLNVKNASSFTSIPSTGAEVAALFTKNRKRTLDLLWNSNEDGHDTKYTGTISSEGQKDEVQTNVDVTDYTTLEGSIPTEYQTYITIVGNKITIAANEDTSIRDMNVTYLIKDTTISANITIKQAASSLVYYWGNNVDVKPTIIPSDATQITNNPTTFNMTGNGVNKCIYLFIPSEVLATKSVTFVESGIPLDVEYDDLTITSKSYRRYYIQGSFILKTTKVIVTNISNS